ncbi:MAG TPA: murein biosynthesis integral membrane protein MurJ [Planctomycetota bacterium]|nr:murein biosynthesis integral membrane protein MurJ [Planctomycetota bacterium]
MTQPAVEGAAASGADIVGRHRRLVARTALISGLTAASRVLGLVRELLSALLFGDASPVYDAFVTAWRVPNLFRRLLGEGAVSTALQTRLTEVDGDRGDAAGARLFWDVLALALGVALILCGGLIGLVLLMPDSMPGTGWAWLGPEPGALRELLVRVLPYLVFICLAGLAGGGLAVRGRFLGASVSAAAMNLTAIATLVLIGVRFGWHGLGPEDGPEGFERHLEMARLYCWGLVLSGVAQLATLLPDLRASGLLARGVRTAADAWGAARGVLLSSAPLALGAAVYQVNVMIDGFMAQYMLPQGGATTYYYANRIQQLPLALVATAATSAVFPALKALGHRGQGAEMRRLHDTTHLAIGFVALPATLALIVLAGPICAVLLEHGAFSEAGTQRTALGMQFLALALVPAGASGLLSRTYFALGDFRTPVRISAGLLFLNLGLNLAFVRGLGMDIEGLTLSTAIVSWSNVALLVPGVLTRLPAPIDGPPFARRLARMLLAASLCAGAAWGTQRLVGPDARSTLALAAAVAVGLVVYFAAAAWLGLEEWHAIRSRGRSRMGRSKSASEGLEDERPNPDDER